MLFKRLVRWLCGKETSPVSSLRKTYAQRYEETNGMSNDAIDHLIDEREGEGRPTGVAHGVAADRSEARARAYSIDPPRPGRKTYMQRYWETSALPVDQLRLLRAERKAQGKETGVIDRVLSECT